MTMSQIQLLRHLPSRRITDVGLPHHTVCQLCQTIINNATPGTDSEFIVTLPCKQKHIFHEVCFAQWVINHRCDDCPTCKTKITPQMCFGSQII